MLQALQEIPDEDQEFTLSKGDLICTLDVQYLDNEAYVAMDLMEWEKEIFQIYLSKEEVKHPYKPGFFAFREGPVLLAAIRKLQAKISDEIRLLIIDGHGTAHPRRMGLASWVGIKANLCSMGIAKDTLVKMDFSELGEKETAFLKLIVEDKWIGSVLRSQTGIKAIFPSAGFRINQSSTLQIAQSIRGQYRIPEPIRRADQAARKFSRGEIEESMILLT
ncbi:MAG: endonuclease V [Bacteroidia bacterium]|nr:endonuclease V [Bacteroidia bacterium]